MADLPKPPTTAFQLNQKDKDEDDCKEKEVVGEEEEAEMAPTAIHRSSSRPQLDLSGAAIQGNFEERNPTILLPNQSDDISHLALDIGGEVVVVLCVLVYAVLSLPFLFDFFYLR